MTILNRFDSSSKTRFSLTRNIVILSLTLNPLLSSAAFAANNTQNAQIKAEAKNQIKNIATQKYTVNIGETAESIAKRFNMSIELLQSLNSAIPFKKQLSELQPGDVVLVPLTALPKDIDVASTKVLTAEDIQKQTKIANLVSQAGTNLNNNNSGANTASSLARNMATTAVNTGLENWFSKYGRLRAQIETDEKFSLKNSQLDAMLPLWENENNLFFTQTSFHNTDDRNQGNLGFGLRHFYDNFMIGGNTFIDYDFSNKHQRAGIGAEYWSNFLKVSANGYMRLSDWRESKDVEDYSERAANGWDLRAEAYLPIYPQLGGKLMYEQYYGDEVALFGHNNDRRKDPNAVTAGISYTPVPLVSVNVDHKQGQDGQKDTIFGLQMNYQIGVPFAKQIDPKAVAALRSLAGNKYDFVNRNNNIVLEYKKNETIWLHLDPELQGLAGETKALNVSVESKHGLDHIEWNADSLTAAGGQIIENGNSYSIKLPTYQTSRDAVANSYTISAVAFDTKGNPSARQSMTVKVSQAAVSEANSSFTPNTIDLVANGKDSQVLTLNIKDASNNPIDVSEKDIDLKITSNPAKAANTTVSEWKKVSTGTYEVTVTAGMQVEKVILSPTVSGVTLPAATVQVAEGDVAELNSTLVASPKEIVADNTEESTLTLTLLDENKNPIKGKEVTFNVDGVENTTISAVTEKNGVYSATLKGTQTGTATIKASIDGKELSLKDQIKLKAGAISEEKSTITASAPTITAGIDEAEITLKLVDGNDNPIEKGNVQFKAEGVAESHFSDVTFVDGVYKAKFSSKDFGTATISASYNNAPINNTSTQIQVIQNIDFEVNMTQKKVKVGEANGITIFAFDANTTSEHIPVKNVEFEISYKNVDRQGENRNDSGVLLVNDKSVRPNEKLTLKTNELGMLENLILKDPNGIGVNHIFEIHLKNKPEKVKTADAIFTVLTSPDSPSAQMWGHMSDAPLYSTTGAAISRPRLLGDSPIITDGYFEENNEKWQLHKINRADGQNGVVKTCGSIENASRIVDLVGLSTKYGNKIEKEYGWPTSKHYISNSYLDNDPEKLHTIDLSNGET